MTDRQDGRPTARDADRPRRRTERRPTDDHRPTTPRATMTDTDRRDDAGAQQLADVDHTNPNTGRTFGGNFTFARGGAVAADGGRPDVAPEDGEGPEDEEAPQETSDDEEGDTLGDVEHTPPNASDDANRVFERGGSDE